MLRSTEALIAAIILISMYLTISSQSQYVQDFSAIIPAFPQYLTKQELSSIVTALKNTPYTITDARILYKGPFFKPITTILIDAPFKGKLSLPSSVVEEWYEQDFYVISNKTYDFYTFSLTIRLRIPTIEGKPLPIDPYSVIVLCDDERVPYEVENLEYDKGGLVLSLKVSSARGCSMLRILYRVMS